MRRLPLVLLATSCAMLVLGLIPGAPAGGLMVFGVTASTALRVGQEFGNGVTVVGLGLLLVGFAFLLRQSRVDQSRSAYRRALDSLAMQQRTGLSQVDGSAMVLSLPAEGMDVELRVDLSAEGEVAVCASLPSQQRFEVRRRDTDLRGGQLEKRLAIAGLELIAEGDRWEARSDGGPRVVQIIQTPALVRAVDALFAHDAVRSFAQDGSAAAVRTALVHPEQVAEVAMLGFAVLQSLRAATE